MASGGMLFRRAIKTPGKSVLEGARTVSEEENVIRSMNVGTRWWLKRRIISSRTEASDSD